MIFQKSRPEKYISILFYFSLAVIAAASITETEVFGANKFDIPGYRRDPLWSLEQPHSELVHRFASSAAHVAGRNQVISESFTWLRNHFHTALSHMMSEAERFLFCGINGIFFLHRQNGWNTFRQ